MYLFLTGLLVGAFAAFLFYCRARRGAAPAEDDRQVVSQETQIVVDFMHHMAEAMADNPRREALYQRIVHASILCTGALSACIFEKTAGNMMRGVAVEGLFPPHKPLPDSGRAGIISRAKFIEQVLKSETFPVGDGVVGNVAQTGKGELIPDAKADPRVVRHYDPALEVRSIIAVPVTFGKRFFGVLAVTNPAGSHPFTQTDFSLVQSLAEQAAIALHTVDFINFQLEKKQLDMDLSLASNIQQMLLPHGVPQIDGFDIDTRYSPAQKVGGDFYDLFVLSETKLGVAVGDVSGKGVAASLLMAICRTNLRQIAPRFESPARVLVELNHVLSEDIQQGLYITMVFAIIDTEYNEVTFARAGHELPFFAREDRADKHFKGEFIGSEGMPIGMVEEMIFAEIIKDRHEPLMRGESLVLYTDGITEMPNEDGKEFSGARLMDAVRASRKGSAKEINDHVLESVSRFAGPEKQRDDYTLVTIKRV
ncbi:sigma-B regulation protein RsbU (phosphoserine phosphatase) [Ereboglobus sp. PH5-5]|uniref:Protein serine phosphatase n=1 Tax=Ereboglobus luteus TaxID=1796921 RepID=A0A2U8E6I4_9BACT|nr:MULTISPECIES: GAF domain-containing SpoIIE family protein phosphatase [Ereboglobus]AWI10375.1 protein serine phosphatase [Ereboglobus luteus]MDF9827559.1 sigma-B regulation protein RsbU (phosphoserine phosphatase) [Ereboglobus sp. PH5-10]MDF9833150.1 sigma-B regulation protein RsbU (phosphoserine phosphatase) [Ereboglobus sp. PH5-5]